jgi:hypothetical protein
MLRLVALLSAFYDILIGILFLTAADTLAVMFGSPLPNPRVLADTNGLFLLCIGLGYLLPIRDPVRYRAYLWLMGPLLKGAGSAVFLLDYLLRGSPAAFLLFSVTDGILAIWTLEVLLRTRRRAASPTPPPASNATRAIGA